CVFASFNFGIANFGVFYEGLFIDLLSRPLALGVVVLENFPLDFVACPLVI
ncbi:12284_t:CDS:1, partial [Gigaspora rosea]